MVESLAGIVLAAGAGTRLLPLTRWRPKPLCPVGDTTLLDATLARLAPVIGGGPDRVAVNAHHHAEQIAAHVSGRAHVSIEAGQALGTAGAVAHLRDWLDGRPALVVNGDTWTTIDLAPLVDGWDGERVRVLVAGEAELAPDARVLGSLLPPPVVAGLPHRPAGLYEVCWRPAQASGDLDVAGASGPFVACDRPRDYLRANLLASGGDSVIGAGAVVHGELVRSVVWPGGVVRAGEVLVDAVRVGATVTVLVR
jgi:NDP-sugar pyrophosphorylase family protein